MHCVAQQVHVNIHLKENVVSLQASYLTAHSHTHDSQICSSLCSLKRCHFSLCTPSFPDRFKPVGKQRKKNRAPFSCICICLCLKRIFATVVPVYVSTTQRSEFLLNSFSPDVCKSHKTLSDPWRNRGFFVFTGAWLVKNLKEGWYSISGIGGDRLVSESSDVFLMYLGSKSHMHIFLNTLLQSFDCDGGKEIYHLFPGGGIYTTRE